jgi:hypothetical protein
MVLTRTIPTRRTPARPTGRLRRVVLPATSPTARQRRGDGPEDRALYSCGCGHAFQADVTATVDCPRCGALQDW